MKRGGFRMNKEIKKKKKRNQKNSLNKGGKLGSNKESGILLRK